MEDNLILLKCLTIVASNAIFINPGHQKTGSRNHGRGSQKRGGEGRGEGGVGREKKGEG
jgi:hypothetical protein